MSVWGWAAGYESWLIEHEIIQGSPGSPETWDALAALKAREWPVAGCVESMRIHAMAVDTGGEFTADAYRQIRRFRDHTIIPCRGVEGWRAPAAVTRAGRAGKARRLVELRNVSSGPLKAELYADFG